MSGKCHALWLATVKQAKRIIDADDAIKKLVAPMEGYLKTRMQEFTALPKAEKAMQKADWSYQHKLDLAIMEVRLIGRNLGEAKLKKKKKKKLSGVIKSLISFTKKLKNAKVSWVKLTPCSPDARLGGKKWTPPQLELVKLWQTTEKELLKEMGKDKLVAQIFSQSKVEARLSELHPLAQQVQTHHSAVAGHNIQRSLSEGRFLGNVKRIKNVFKEWKKEKKKLPKPLAKDMEKFLKSTNEISKNFSKHIL